MLIRGPWEAFYDKISPSQCVSIHSVSVLPNSLISPLIYWFLLAWPCFRVYGWQADCRDICFIDCEVWQHTCSSHTIYYVDKETPSTEECCTPTETHEHTQKNISNIQCENFSGGSSPVAQMFLLAPQQVVMGWHRGPNGVCGAAEGQTGPQSLVEGFLCGTQSIVYAGKGHGDGNTAQR